MFRRSIHGAGRACGTSDAQNAASGAKPSPAARAKQTCAAAVKYPVVEPIATPRSSQLRGDIEYAIDHVAVLAHALDGERHHLIEHAVDVGIRGVAAVGVAEVGGGAGQGEEQRAGAPSCRVPSAREPRSTETCTPLRRSTSTNGATGAKQP